MAQVPEHLQLHQAQQKLFSLIQLVAEKQALEGLAVQLQLKFYPQHLHYQPGLALFGQVQVMEEVALLVVVGVELHLL